MHSNVSATSSARVAPSWKPASVVTIGYAIIVTGLMAASGVKYAELLQTSDNVLHGAVIPLAAGTVFLLATHRYLRWDHVFIDPGRLPMTGLLWAPPVIMVVGAIIRFTGVPAGISLGHVGLIVLAGVLVGFAEETVFRGYLLRGLRAGTLPEVKIALIVAAAFGLFHLTNVFVGSPVSSVIVQVFLAGASGFALYLARRGTGLLVAGMAIHGFWDISTFLTASRPDVSNFGTKAGTAFIGLNLLLTLIAILWMVRRQPTLKLSDSGELVGT